MEVTVFQPTGVDEELSFLVFPRQIFRATQQLDFHVVGGLVDVQDELALRVIQGDGIECILSLRVANARLLAGISGLQTLCR